MEEKINETTRTGYRYRTAYLCGRNTRKYQILKYEIIQISKSIEASGADSRQTSASADYADRNISEAENSTERRNRAAFDARGSDHGDVYRAI